MADNFDFSDLDDEVIEVPHDFVIELNHLVTTNHTLVLQAINADEDAELAKHYSDDDEAQRSIENSLQTFYEGLRRAANNLAAVALVTRIHHRLNKMANTISAKPNRNLAAAFAVLTSRLGDGPVPVDDFERLVTVRDSVIHGDGQKTWQFPPGKTRTVAPEYTNSGDETEISEDQLKEAVAKSIEQVEWFDEKLEGWKKRAVAK
jgi:hypothetical protein